MCQASCSPMAHFFSVFWTVSSTMSFSSLIFSYIIPNLSLITSNIFFISDTVVFNFRSTILIFFNVFHVCTNMFNLFPSFLNTWNIVIKFF